MVMTSQTMTVSQAMQQGRVLRSQAAWRGISLVKAAVKRLFGYKAAKGAKATPLGSCTA